MYFRMVLRERERERERERKKESKKKKEEKNEDGDVDFPNICYFDCVIGRARSSY